MDQDGGGLALLELRLEPVELFFAQRAYIGIETERSAVLSAAEEIVEVDKFIAFAIQGGIRLGVEPGLVHVERLGAVEVEDWDLEPAVGARLEREAPVRSESCAGFMEAESWERPWQMGS